VPDFDPQAHCWDCGLSKNEKSLRKKKTKEREANSHQSTREGGQGNVGKRVRTGTYYEKKEGEKKGKRITRCGIQKA